MVIAVLGGSFYRRVGGGRDGRISPELIRSPWSAVAGGQGRRGSYEAGGVRRKPRLG
jgi:hypothetical protein